MSDSKMSSLPPAFVVDADGRIDPYRLAHKALRMLLGRLLEAAGRTDFADAIAVESLRTQSMAAVDVLRTHARVEVLFIDAYLVSPSAGNDLQREHTALDAELFGLVRALDDLGGLARDDARMRGHVFYLALSRFVARYLLHMVDEETRALPLLHRQVDDETLREVLVAAQSALQAKERTTARAAIADAVAPHERDILDPRTGSSPRKPRAA